MMEFEVKTLDKSFYRDYPHNEYPELLVKEKRPYNCIVVEYAERVYLCIPFRSHIKHCYAYLFASENSIIDGSGLDYTKIVVVNNLKYIGASATVNRNVYKEIFNNSSYIYNEACNYVNGYISYIKKEAGSIGRNKYNRMYGKSTLKYFHNELGI